MRARKDLLQTTLAALLVLLAAAIAIPLTEVISSYIPRSVAGNRWLWFGVLIGVAAAIVMLTWLPMWLEKRAPSTGFVGVPETPGWIEREELPELVKALTAAGSEPVALTTGLFGAGGFGKTMLAARACRDRTVRRRFGGRVVWITVGRDLSGAGLAAKISETIRNLGREIPPFTGPEQAGQALAETLSEARTLLVADDVWSADQLEPFLTAGHAGRLLVTTRRPTLLSRAEAAHRIKVDTVTGEVARPMLTRKLQPSAASGRWTRELLDITGAWPLLLSLVNHRLVEDVASGAVLDRAAADAVNRLRQAGPTALDLNDLKIRESAVAATIDYSLDVLEPPACVRFLELGIFAEDAEIPLTMVALLWRGAAGLSEISAQSLCERLQGLSLVSLAWAGEVRVVILHDVIRDFVVRRLGPARCAAAHAALIAAARDLIGPTPSAAWWRLPETAGAGYLWPNLTYHLKAAGLESELDQLCCDLRFLAVRLRNAGPAAVEADLARSASPTAGRLRHAIAQNASLLAPVEPTAALTTILTSRLGDVPELADQLPVLRTDLHAWTAWPTWRPPDLPPDGPSDHTGWVSAVAISRDGSWLATAHHDNTARTWAANGTPLATLTGHAAGVLAVAISPDGTWLATGSNDNTVRVWASGATDTEVHSVTAIRVSGPVWACAWLPDGTDICIGGSAGLYRFALSPEGG